MATRIPYLDEVWNVTSGCSPVSPGCTNCWARRMFGRNLWKCPECGGEGERVTLLGDGVDCPACDGTGTQDFTPTFHADRLEQPLHWRKPRRVGVSFMGDLFHEAFTYSQIGDVLDIIDACPQHTFLTLTKRPDVMCERLDWNLEGKVVPNLWLGVTVCNQAEADRNIPILLATPAAVRWVSLEPMLAYLCDKSRPPRAGDQPAQWSYGDLDLVICGPETGPGARSFDPKWATDVKARCDAAGIPYFDKRESHKHWREMPAVTP